PEILDNDISFLRQLLEKTLAFGVPKVQGDALLVTPDDRPPHRRLAPRLRAPVPHRITLAGSFDLDDLGAHVAEQLAAERTRDQRAELEHAQIGEGAADVGGIGHGGAFYHRR